MNTILIPEKYAASRTCPQGVSTGATGTSDAWSIPIVEGEARQPDDCVHLGKCMIDDLPEDLSAGNQVVVEYTLDAAV